MYTNCLCSPGQISTIKMYILTFKKCNLHSWLACLNAVPKRKCAVDGSTPPNLSVHGGGRTLLTKYLCDGGKHGVRMKRVSDWDWEGLAQHQPWPRTLHKLDELHPKHDPIDGAAGPPRPKFSFFADLSLWAVDLAFFVNDEIAFVSQRTKLDVLIFGHFWSNRVLDTIDSFPTKRVGAKLRPLKPENVPKLTSLLNPALHCLVSYRYGPLTTAEHEKNKTFSNDLLLPLKPLNDLLWTMKHKMRFSFHFTAA